MIANFTHENMLLGVFSRWTPINPKMNPDSPFLRKTLLACGITAVVETIIVLSIAEPAILLFVLGPIAFLTLIAARRKANAARARRLHGVAVGIGMFGIASFGVAFLTHRRDAAPDAVPIAPLVVPVVQWLVVLWVWIGIARQESREKRQQLPG